MVCEKYITKSWVPIGSKKKSVSEPDNNTIPPIIGPNLVLGIFGIYTSCAPR